jgi:hypothetical protein
LSISSRPLWWPPDKICGRYLAPYLSSQVGDAADVMPHDADAIPVETTLNRTASEAHPSFHELTDLPRR